MRVIRWIYRSIVATLLILSILLAILWMCTRTHSQEFFCEGAILSKSNSWDVTEIEDHLQFECGEFYWFHEPVDGPGIVWDGPQRSGMEIGWTSRRSIERYLEASGLEPDPYLSQQRHGFGFVVIDRGGPWRELFILPIWCLVAVTGILPAARYSPKIFRKLKRTVVGSASADPTRNAYVS